MLIAIACHNGLFFGSIVTDPGGLIMTKSRIHNVLCGIVIGLALLTVSSRTVHASESSPVASNGVATSSGWFSFFRGRSSKSYYNASSKKAPPSMSNGSFYEKWRADRKVSGRAHRP